MQRWVQDPNYTARVSRVPQRFKAAARSQNAIGWRHLFLGRMSKEYRNLYQELTGPEDPSTTGAMAKKWGAEFVTLVWAIFEHIWNERNATLHGQRGDDRKRKALHRISRLYESRSRVLPQDRFLFDKTLESWEALSSTRIERWCNTAEKAIAKSSSMGVSQILATHWSLEDYFIRTDRPPGTHGTS